jgi:putative colanic acid biosysnthesis UDP-glucose lipid carrier transferase
MIQSKKLIYILFDFLALNIILTLTYCWFFNSLAFMSLREFKVLSILNNLLWLSTLLYFNHIYKRFEYSTLSKEIELLLPNFLTHVFVFYILSILLFHRPGFSFSFYFGALFVTLLFNRLFIKLVMSFKTLNYITIGNCDAILSIESALSEAHRGKTNCLGTFSDDPLNDKKYLGVIADIEAYLENNKVNLILYVSNGMSPDALRHLMHYAKHHFIEFKIIPMELDYLTEGAKVALHHGVFLSAQDEYAVQENNALLKRLFDVVFASFVIVFILSWLFPLVCLIIRLDSKGTPLFIQDRVGLRGRIFRCLKFRSLKVIENGQEVVQVKQNDSRITKVGAFMRKANLDEMPQFFNVLRGDMSIVGPRPHPVSLDEDFKIGDEAYNLRHYTKPGITGWAQVNGWRGPTDTSIKITRRTQCDLWYLKNWSFLLDIKIIFLTVFGSKVRHNAF